MNSANVASAWQDAVNQHDIDRLLDLSDPNIEIVGPKGSGYGHQLLRDWLDRAGLELITLRTFAHADSVVIAQHGTWRSQETGAIIGEADVASAFRVADKRVTRFARYDSLTEALAAMGLSEADELQ